MEEKDLLKMNLQYFAEDPGSEGGNQDDPNKEDNPGGQDDDKGKESEKGQDERTWNRDELAKMINAETQKIEAKYEDLLERTREDAISEGKRLAKMSEEERKEEEENLRLKKIEEREAELNRREMRTTTAELVREEGLPQTFVDLVVADEAETVQNNIKAVKEAFDKAVSEEVDNRLVQKQTKTGTSTGSLTKQDIMKVKNKAEREKLIAENMDLFTK